MRECINRCRECTIFRVGAATAGECARGKDNVKTPTAPRCRARHVGGHRFQCYQLCAACERSDLDTKSRFEMPRVAGWVDGETTKRSEPRVHEVGIDR